MSYDEYDAWQDAALDAFYERAMEDPSIREDFYHELYDEIVKDFTGARMRSRYESDPDIAESAANALGESRQFLDAGSHSAAQIFAVIAAEVGLKSALLTPIIHGLVHADSAASLIAKLVVSHRDEGFTKILLSLLADHGGVDLLKYQRPGSSKKLWEELKSSRQKRNLIVHQGQHASQDEAELAVAVAAAILEDIFPRVIANVGLHLEGMKIRATPTGASAATIRP